MATTPAKATFPLILEDTYVRQDEQGRFSLNDLHQAAGGEEHHKPSRFTRTDTFTALVEPEATRFGVRGFQPPVPFENFCFLYKGGGSFTSAAGAQTLGALAPFPASGQGGSQPVGSGPATACDAPN